MPPLKLAFTSALFAPAAIVQLPVPLQAPLQPVKVLPLLAWAIRVTAVVLAKLAEVLLQSTVQLKPVGVLVTLPLPLPSLVSVTRRVLADVAKLAVTLALLVPAAIVQLPVPLQAPPQPAKVLPLLARAVRLMVAVFEKLPDAPLQSMAHESPVGLLVTLPVPIPDLANVTVRVVTSAAKFAVTLRALSTLTLQVLLEPAQAPPQPLKMLPVAACAVSVTAVPAAKLAEQVLQQLMPDGELLTVPVPVPWFVTDKA